MGCSGTLAKAVGALLGWGVQRDRMNRGGAVAGARGCLGPLGQGGVETEPPAFLGARHPPRFLLPGAFCPQNHFSLALWTEHRVARSSKRPGIDSPVCCLIKFTLGNLFFLICKVEIMMLPCQFCSRMKGNDVCDCVYKRPCNVQ